MAKARANEAKREVEELGSNLQSRAEAEGGFARKLASRRHRRRGGGGHKKHGGGWGGLSGTVGTVLWQRPMDGGTGTRLVSH